ncbi:MAG: hypothetical protein LBF16_03810, partial [Pseudomonadales bacterium]|nr:hypothetical protein [Pseudomonadales bacterium]
MFKFLMQLLSLYRLSVGGLMFVLAACGGGNGADTASVSSNQKTQLEIGPLANDDVNSAVQIKSMVQDAGDRVLPHVITLPELVAVKTAPQPQAGLGQPVQIGVVRAVPQAADAQAMAGLLSWHTSANGSRRAALSVQSPGA